MVRDKVSRQNVSPGSDFDAAVRRVDELARQGTDSELREALELCLKALKAHQAAWITIAPLIDTPYPDDPRWTPWTRFGDRACKRGSEAMQRAKALLR